MYDCIYETSTSTPEIWQGTCRAIPSDTEDFAVLQQFSADGIVISVMLLLILAAFITDRVVSSVSSIRLRQRKIMYSGGDVPVEE